MDRSLCDIELKMVVKRDDKSPVLDSAEGVVESLSGQALARGAACEVQPTRSWGAPDLDADLAVHVVSGPTLHHPRPWSLNAAVIPADAPAAPANLGDYDLICRMSAGNAAMASFEAPSGGEAPPAAPLAGLFDALADLVGRSPWAGRLAGARERARTISEHGPLVSVLLPTHDRLGFLGAAVDSVLAQSYRNWELLVIQDGGPDVDAVLAQRPDARIRLLKLDGNRGKAAALNAAAPQMRGECVAYLDDDDVWLPGHLEALMGVLALAPGVRFAFSDGERLARRRTPGGWEIDESSRSLPYSGHVALEDLLESNGILGITVAHDRALIDEAGPFDERLETLVDFDMWRRMAAISHPCHVSRVTAEYFVWAGDDPARSQMTGLYQRDLPRYLANKARVLSKRLPGSLPPNLHERWAAVRRHVRYEFLLQRGLSFLRRDKRPERARVSLGRARGFCPSAAEFRRILAIACLEAADPVSCLELLQQCLADPQGRRAADYLYAGLANLQLGRSERAAAMLERLESEIACTPEERGLAQRYKAMARQALKTR